MLPGLHSLRDGRRCVLCLFAFNGFELFGSGFKPILKSNSATQKGRVAFLHGL